jgi:predicted O-methyltransferase YrrM
VNKLKIIFKYIKYLIKSTNKHGAYSPFVSDLLQNVIYVKADYYSYKSVEKIREQLLDSDKEISYLEYGASANSGKIHTKKISDIVSSASKSPKYAQLLFRLVNYFQPKNILELGTSLGISALYMAKVNAVTPILTIEASKEIAAVAKNNFEQMQIKNINQTIGNFDEVLPEIVSKYSFLDFVFFDGNHQKKATLNYFDICLKKAHENSIFVFDDINWSDEMTEAWEEIKNHKEVIITIDLFFMGLVFFKKGHPKQHFIIRF